MTLQAELTSGNARASAGFELTSQRLTLTQRLSCQVSVTPAIANRLLGQQSGAGGLAEPMDLLFNADQLSIGLGNAPLAPDVFALDAKATVASAAVTTARGERVETRNIAASLHSTEVPGSINVKVSAGEVWSGSTGTIEGPQVNLIVNDLANADGLLTLADAVLSGTVVGGAPTELIEPLMQGNGLLGDLLGPTVRVDVSCEDLSAHHGRFVAQADTEYAQLQIAGRPRERTLHCEGDAVAMLSRITPELSERAFERALPIVQHIEKTTDDRPAVVRTTSLTLPMDGDLKKLNGKAEVDLGTVRFETTGFVSKLLKASHNRQSGQIGRRIDPFRIDVRDGVATYSDTNIPLGEFTITTRGTVDLVQQKLDLVLFIPLFALADEVSSGLGGGKALNRLTMIPFRITGPTSKPKVKLAGDLLAKGIVPNALEGLKDKVGDDADTLIKKGVNDLLKGIGKKKHAP